MKLLASLPLVFLAPAISFGQIYIHTFEDVDGDQSFQPIFVDTNVTGSSVMIGLGMSDNIVNPADQRFFSSFSADTQPRSIFENTFFFGTTTEESVARNNYWGFSVTPDENYQMDLTDFSAAVARGGGGVSNTSFFALRSSLDGFSSDLGTIAATAGGGFDDLNSPSDPNRGQTFRLNANLGSEFQNLTEEVEFRLYVSTDNPFSGWFARTDTWILNGTTELIPEPSTLSLLGLAGLVCGLIIRRNRR